MSDPDRNPALEPALRDVDNIQNLDTARMALRWALERMRALEKRADEMEAVATECALSLPVVPPTTMTRPSRRTTLAAAHTP